MKESPLRPMLRRNAVKFIAFAPVWAKLDLLPAAKAEVAYSTRIYANRSRFYLGQSGYSVETPGKKHSISVLKRADRQQAVVRVELRPGEQRPNERDPRERVEFRSSKSSPNGVTRWYAGAFRIGDFVPDASYTIIMQWFSDASNRLPEPPGPWLRFALARGKKGVLEISHRGSDENGAQRERETTAVDLGVESWHNFVVEARTGLDDGLVRVWIDGKKVVDWGGGLLGDFVPKGDDAARAGVLKFGVYRWWSRPDGKPQTSTAVMWFTNIEQGPADLSRRIRNPLPPPVGV